MKAMSKIPPFDIRFINPSSTFAVQARLSALPGVRRSAVFNGSPGTFFALVDGGDLLTVRESLEQYRPAGIVARLLHRAAA